MDVFGCVSVLTKERKCYGFICMIHTNVFPHIHSFYVNRYENFKRLDKKRSFFKNPDVL